LIFLEKRRGLKERRPFSFLIQAGEKAAGIYSIVQNLFYFHRINRIFQPKNLIIK